LVASLISLLEAGTSPWRREWDAAAGGHQVNLLSGRRYCGANPVLLTLGMHLRGSALPYWCGFGEAKALGIFPRKGSKAVHVLRPQLHHHSESELAGAGSAAGADDCGAGKTAAGEAAAGETAAGEGAAGEGPGRSWVSYRPVAVFNAADLEGEALEALIQKRRQAEGLSQRPEPERLAAAEAVLSCWPVPVSFGGDRACYLPAADRIALPDRAAFHSAAALYATWAHEAIHSSGHSSRLARDLSGGMGDGGDGGRAYAREELVAELGAVLLGHRLEIGTAMANHAAYLSHWLELLRESPRLLLQVLSDARKAADLICPEDPQEARGQVVN
jgi:antirestriction protein ArdC